MSAKDSTAAPTRVPSVRGRIQDRPRKDLILATIGDGAMTQPEIEAATGLGRKLVRRHVYLLEYQGELFRVDGTSPIQFSKDPHFKPAKHGDSVRRVVPAGQWSGGPIQKPHALDLVGWLNG